MAEGYNKQVIVGNLTKDPEMRYTQNGKAVATFSVGVGRRKIEGQDDKTDFFRCKAWAKTAEFIGEYMKKGKQVLVEGRTEFSSYEKDGEMKYITELVVETFKPLGKKDD